MSNGRPPPRGATTLLIRAFTTIAGRAKRRLHTCSRTRAAESDVVAEIERYIVMPGQATAYKVGMMKMLELRERATMKLGDRFDIRDFHDVVLKNGAVPLDILERLIDDYIKATLSGQAPS